MTLPALELLKEFTAMLDALHSELGLRWNLDWRAWLFRRPARGERLDECHKVRLPLGCKRDPTRHVREVESAHDGIVQIGIERQSARRCRAAFEYRGDEVARRWCYIWSVFAVAISTSAVASPTVAVVKRRSWFRVPGQISDMRFFVRIRLRGRRRQILGRNSQRSKESDCDLQAKLAEHLVLHGHSPLEREVDAEHQAAAGQANGQ